MWCFKDKYAFILSFVLFFSVSLISQNKESSNKFANSEKSHFSIGMNYNNDAVFMGRKDSIAAPYLYTTIMYKHKTGIYASGSFSFLTNQDENTIDLYLFSSGYNFLKKNFYGDISVSAYYFNEHSSNIISKVIADLTAQLQYDFSFINLGMIASVYFNDNRNSDFYLSPQISHDIITKNNKFQFSPTFSMNCGSQNFYQEFIRKYKAGSSYGSHDRDNGNGDGDTAEIITEITIEESERFKIMAYELSLSAWYIGKSYFIIFNPSVSFPQNEATIVEDERVKKENLETTFNWLIGINYKF